MQRQKKSTVFQSYYPCLLKYHFNRSRAAKMKEVMTPLCTVGFKVPHIKKVRSGKIRLSRGARRNGPYLSYSNS